MLSHVAIFWAGLGMVYCYHWVYINTKTCQKRGSEDNGQGSYSPSLPVLMSPNDGSHEPLSEDYIANMVTAILSVASYSQEGSGLWWIALMRIQSLGQRADNSRFTMRWPRFALSIRAGVEYPTVSRWILWHFRCSSRVPREKHGQQIEHHWGTLSHICG